MSWIYLVFYSLKISVAEDAIEMEMDSFDYALEE